jgi:hypothetical protein
MTNFKTDHLLICMLSVAIRKDASGSGSITNYASPDLRQVFPNQLYHLQLWHVLTQIFTYPVFVTTVKENRESHEHSDINRLSGYHI